MLTSLLRELHRSMAQAGRSTLLYYPVYNGIAPWVILCCSLSHSMIHVPRVATMSTQRKIRQLMMRRKLSLAIV